MLRFLRAGVLVALNGRIGGVICRPKPRLHLPYWLLPCKNLRETCDFPITYGVTGHCIGIPGLIESAGQAFKRSPFISEIFSVLLNYLMYLYYLIDYIECSNAQLEDESLPNGHRPLSHRIAESRDGILL